MNKQDLIEKIANNEELIGRLYKLYAQKYGEYSDFWGRLSDDERSHSDKIRSFAANDEFEIDSKRFNEKDIVGFENEVREATEKIEQEEISLSDALKTALKLENNLVEKEFFKIFETDSDRLKFYLGEMGESISKHQDRIKKMIEKIK